MRNIFISIFLITNFFASAQKTKPLTYFYTQSTEKYFSDGEIDRLLYDQSLVIFKENLIPLSLFEKKYPVVKNLLISASRSNIILSFKAIEAKLKKDITSVKDSTQFTDNKKLFTEALQKQIRISFYSNKLLKQYLSFSTSDRITYFNSTVRINPNGKLTVIEKITVYNGNGSSNPLYEKDTALEKAGGANNEIKRGIVRSFPLYYVNKYKLFQNTTFIVKEVLRDGKKEKYHTEKKANGILLYTGSSNIYLESGVYTYTITYETDQQLKLLNDFDELYWNATGNSWSFRIDSATCTVILPKGAMPLSSRCYTGVQGEKKEDCNINTTTVGDSTFVVFKANNPLPPNQGITVAISWPKGYVTAKGSAWAKTKYYIWNNKGVFFLPLAALFSILFCFICWLLYGRDPDRGTIYPQFEPPAGYSPAALGYIYDQKFSRQLTAATIVDAAVRNMIKIEVEREGRIFKHNEYTIGSSDKSGKKPLSPYEDFESDIEDLVDTTIKKGKYNSELGDLNKKVQKYCESNYKADVKKKSKGFFKLNTSYTTIPVLICTIAGIWALIDGVMRAVILKNYWHIAYFAAGVILCSVVFRIFTKLLPAYSKEGRKLKDTIEGFRMFLSAADEKRFDTMNPPKKSLELYEKYLPFAIALGCEIEWGQQFEDIINTAYLGGTAATSLSNSFSRDSNNFSSSFTSSFSGAISSASSPPSSSSGGGSSFGGGSSGGGGGGGGGRGW